MPHSVYRHIDSRRRFPFGAIMVLSCLLMLGGLGVLAYGKTTASLQSTSHYAHLTRAKDGSHFHMKPAHHYTGVLMVTVGFIGLAFSGWRWSMEMDTKRRPLAKREPTGL